MKIYFEVQAPMIWPVPARPGDVVGLWSEFVGEQLVQAAFRYIRRGEEYEIVQRANVENDIHEFVSALLSLERAAVITPMSFSAAEWRAYAAGVSTVARSWAAPTATRRRRARAGAAPALRLV